MKLEFTFDAELAKLTEEKVEEKKPMIDAPKPIPMPNHSSHSSSTPSSLNDVTSPGTDDLNLKIASVKNVWENTMSSLYEHSSSIASSSATLVSSSATVSVSESLNEQPVSSASQPSQQQQQHQQAQHQVSVSQQASSQHYSNFSHNMGDRISPVDLTAPTSNEGGSHSDPGISMPSHHHHHHPPPAEISVPDLGSSPSDHLMGSSEMNQSPLSYDNNMGMGNKNKYHQAMVVPAVGSDQNKVCKVKPQQQIAQQQQMSNSQVAQMMANVAGIPSPPAGVGAAQQVSQVIIAAAAQQVSQQYHPFIGSQIVQITSTLIRYL